MNAEDFKIDPIRHGNRIVRPANSARRGRDERPHADEGSARDSDADAEPRPEHPDPQPPSAGEPGIDILARGHARGRNLTAAAIGKTPDAWQS
jgi:hypothetical protein